MASSIHIKKAVNGIINHNSREGFSHSVVFTDEKNELLNNSKDAYKIYRSELAKRTKAYTNRTNQKLQKNAITHLSAIVNLEQHHNLDDLEEIKNHLENELDTKVFQMSIHRDEGKLISKDDDSIIFTSGEDFFKNPDDDKLYWDKKYIKEINMNDYNISKNYHAHIEMLGLDTNGVAIKRSKLSKYFLSNLQTLTAKSLNMERGKNYYETGVKAPKRLDVLEFKKENKVKRETIQETKKQAFAKIKDLNNYTKELRAELASSKAETYQEKEEKKKLIREFDSTKKELHSQIKNKQLSEEDLRAAIEDLKEKLSKKPTVEYIENPINTQLEIERETLKSSNLLYKMDKRAYTQNIEDLNFKNISLEQEIEQFQEKLNIQAKKINRLEEENRELENITQSRDVLYIQFEGLQEKNEVLEKKNVILQEENKELKASQNGLKKSFVNVIEKFVKVLDIPKVLNLSFFDSAVEKINSILKENKTLQEQNKRLNDKVIELEKKNDSRPIMEDSEYLNVEYSEDVILEDLDEIERDSKVTIKDIDSFAEVLKNRTTKSKDEILKAEILKEELFKEHDTKEANDILNSYNDENERGLEL